MKNRLPMYLEIKKDIQHRITDGKWGREGPIPTEVELARIYQTSRITVAKSINMLVDDGYLFRIKGTGTFVKENVSSQIENGYNLSFQSPNNIKTDTFTIIYLYNDFIDLLTSSIHKDINLGINEVLKIHPKYHLQPFAVIKCSLLQYSPSIVNFIRESNVKGIISLCKMKGEDLDFLRNIGVPVVWGNTQCFEDNVYTVSTDFYSVAYEAVRYLKSLGHKKIAHITSATILASTQMINQGYHFAMQKLGLKAKTIYINNDEEIGKFISSNSSCTAFFFPSEELAQRARKIITEIGKKIPKDISVITYESGEKPERTRDLTALKGDNKKLGKMIMETVVKLNCNKPFYQANSFVPVEFVDRKSCAKVKK